MGYRIVYPGRKRKRSHHRGKRILVRSLVLLLFMLLLLPAAAQPGKKLMTELMLPEEPAVSAIERVVQIMHDGEGLENALAAFCETVILIEK